MRSEFLIEYENRKRRENAIYSITRDSGWVKISDWSMPYIKIPKKTITITLPEPKNDGRRFTIKNRSNDQHVVIM